MSISLNGDLPYPSPSPNILGWTLKRVPRFESGWDWGPGLPLFQLTNGFDSLTIRAQSPVEALAIVMVEAWPPRSIGRYNWEYA